VMSSSSKASRRKAGAVLRQRVAEEESGLVPTMGPVPAMRYRGGGSRQSGSQQAPQSRSPITPLPKIKIRPTTVTASPTKVGSRFQQHMRQSSSHGKLPQQGKRRPETTSNSKLSLRTSSSSFGDDFY
jgi:hypothetical protein